MFFIPTLYGVLRVTIEGSSDQMNRFRFWLVAAAQSQIFLQIHKKKLSLSINFEKMYQTCRCFGSIGHLVHYKVIR